MLHHTSLHGATGIPGLLAPQWALTVNTAFAWKVTEVPYPAVKCRQLGPSDVTGPIHAGWADDGVAGVCIAASSRRIKPLALSCLLLVLVPWEGRRHAEALFSTNLLFLISSAFCWKEAKGCGSNKAHACMCIGHHPAPQHLHPPGCLGEGASKQPAFVCSSSSARWEQCPRLLPGDEEYSHPTADSEGLPAPARAGWL